MKKVIAIMKILKFALMTGMIYIGLRGFADNMKEVNNVIEEVSDLVKVIWPYALLCGIGLLIYEDAECMIKRLRNRK